MKACKAKETERQLRELKRLNDLGLITVHGLNEAEALADRPPKRLKAIETAKQNREQKGNTMTSSPEPLDNGQHNKTDADDC